MSENSNKGFSLMEIIIILAILAILSAVAFSSFTGIKQRQILNGAVADINSIFFRARNLTLESYESSSYSVKIEIDRVSIIKKADESLFEEVVLPENTTIESGSLSVPNEIIFARLSGDTDKTGTVTVRVGNSTKNITFR